MESLTLADLSLPALSWALLLLPCIVPLAAILLFLYLRLPAGAPASELRRTVFAHRGCMRVESLPENSLPAFAHALSCGVDGLECDVHLSKDGEVMVFHDFDLQRMCGRPERVCELTRAELQSLPFTDSDPAEALRLHGHLGKQLLECGLQGDALAWRIPTLEQLLLLVRRMGTKLFIEIKDFARAKTIAERVAQLVARHGLQDSCYVISFFPQALWHLRRANPRLRTCMLVRRRFLQPLSVNPSTRDDCHWLVRTFPALADLLLYWSCRTWLPPLLGVSMVGPESTISSPDMVERFRKRGYLLSTWVVDDAKKKNQLLSAGGSITTNHLFREDARSFGNPL